MEDLAFLYGYSPTLSLFFDTKYQNKNNYYPLMLKVSFKRKTKLYPLGFEFLKKEYTIIKNFENLKASKKLDSKDIERFLPIKEKIDNTLLNAKIHAESIKDFSFENFECNLI